MPIFHPLMVDLTQFSFSGSSSRMESRKNSRPGALGTIKDKDQKPKTLGAPVRVKEKYSYNPQIINNTVTSPLTNLLPYRTKYNSKSSIISNQHSILVRMLQKTSSFFLFLRQPKGTKKSTNTGKGGTLNDKDLHYLNPQHDEKVDLHDNIHAQALTPFKQTCFILKQHPT